MLENISSEYERQENASSTESSSSFENNNVITWKDVGQEADIVFGILSGLILLLLHLIYILVVLDVITL